EDGIRDFHVTGVQTCALPIYRDAPVVAGVEYVVAAVDLGPYVPWFFVFDRFGLLCPIRAPSILFEVVDSRVSRLWRPGNWTDQTDRKSVVEGKGVGVGRVRCL